ncbi:hypothetical protein ACFPFV_02365 [Salinicoccus siamensis]|uniref:hypothetical protein n=1 Tax=Salinicoccus siamensis TaxID=381830 RepID=UPI003611F2A6
MIIPKTNRAMIYYMLPTFLLLNIITMSRTAIGVYLLIAVIQLAWINFYNTPIKQKKHFAIIAGGGILLILVGFAQPLYQFFIGGRTQSKWHTVECFDIRTL